MAVSMCRQAQLDYLVVECSGITHPVGVIQTLEKRYGKMTRARLDVVLCIVDTGEPIIELSKIH